MPRARLSASPCPRRGRDRPLPVQDRATHRRLGVSPRCSSKTIIFQRVSVVVVALPTAPALLVERHRASCRSVRRSRGLSARGRAAQNVSNHHEKLSTLHQARGRGATYGPRGRRWLLPRPRLCPAHRRGCSPSSSSATAKLTGVSNGVHSVSFEREGSIKTCAALRNAVVVDPFYLLTGVVGYCVG